MREKNVLTTLIFLVPLLIFGQVDSLYIDDFEIIVNPIISISMEEMLEDSTQSFSDLLVGKTVRIEVAGAIDDNEVNFINLQLFNGLDSLIMEHEIELDVNLEVISGNCEIRGDYFLINLQNHLYDPEFYIKLNYTNHLGNIFPDVFSNWTN